ncbi:helix-turn-helix domain-containing protein [Nonomuraea sp. NPDC001023]|uniref:helix-turn-helix domain-containing protein n=1 Tax=unclassified Nonomuraea TaxID=2593643 RepID=UPI0033290555
MSDKSAKSGSGADDRRQALPISEVAELLGVAPITIRRAVASGEFPHVPVRSRKQVPRDFVEALLASPKWGAKPDAEVAV